MLLSTQVSSRKTTNRLRAIETVGRRVARSVCTIGRKTTNRLRAIETITRESASPINVGSQDN